MSCPRRFDVGVYVLGALAPDERVAVEEHLAGCAECTEELRRVGGLPGLLARAEEPPLDDPTVTRAAPPEDMLTVAMARQRRYRRRRLIVAAAAAVLLLGAGTVLGAAVAPFGGASTTVVAARTIELRAANTRVAGEAGLTEQPWGSAIALRCRSSSTAGAPAPTQRTVYVLFVRSPDGSEHEVARWSPPPGHDVDVEAATDLDPAQVAGLQVRTSTGDVVMQG